MQKRDYPRPQDDVSLIEWSLWGLRQTLWRDCKIRAVNNRILWSNLCAAYTSQPGRIRMLGIRPVEIRCDATLTEKKLRYKKGTDWFATFYPEMSMTFVECYGYAEYSVVPFGQRINHAFQMSYSHYYWRKTLTWFDFDGVTWSRPFEWRWL